MPEVNPMQQTGSPTQPMGEGAPSGTPSMGDVVKPGGEIQTAKANVMIAITHLERQLPILGTDSEEGKALLSALSTLSKKFSGSKSEDLAPAELMQLMSSQPDAVKKAMIQEMGSGQNVPGGPGAPQQTAPQFA